MGSATDVLASPVDRAHAHETTGEELQSDLLALPTGELVPLYQRPADPAPRVIAQAPDQIWD